MIQLVTYDFHNTIAHCDDWFQLEIRELPAAKWPAWRIEGPRRLHYEPAPDAPFTVREVELRIDQAGAERLIGKGDMLMLTATSSTAQRVQGAWVTEEEVRDIAKAWRKQAPEVTYNESVQGDAEPTGAAAQLPGGSTGDEDDDELLLQAMDLVVRSQLGSTSMLQRKLRVGFARAGRLMDLLEQRGVVGPSEGSKARAVLMTPEELDGSAPTADDLIGPADLPDEPGF